MPDIKEITAGLLKVKAEDLTSDDMPTAVMRDVFDICGRDTALNLMVYMQGNIIQVPSRPWLKIQEKYILKNYDYSARSIKIMARTIGVTEKFVRDILKGRVKTIPIEGQINFLHPMEENEECH